MCEFCSRRMCLPSSFLGAHVSGILAHIIHEAMSAGGMQRRSLYG